MLVQIDDKILSTELFERKFVCDLNACKGACCVEGDAGAPMTMEEVDILEEIYDQVVPYMRPEGIAAVEETGVFYMDFNNEPATTLVDGAECAFVYFDEQGITKCAIEKAYLEGKTTWKKPISCHLYPIRVSKVGELTALNYDEWKICQPACACGDALNVPVFRFLKEPIIRAYGEEFFSDLENVDASLKSGGLEE
jgi:hypothetical protein